MAIGAGSACSSGVPAEQAEAAPTGSPSGSGSPSASPSASPSSGTATPTATCSTGKPQQPSRLPRGAERILPDHRVVAYYGNATTDELGVLGETGPNKAARRVERAARPFRTKQRPVLPAFELIVTVAQSSAGSDGDYSHPTEPELVRQWLEAARRHEMLLVLDIQPGRARFLPEVQRYEEFLREPDVGLALDSEWRMGPGEVPGETIGSVDAAEVNEVSAWLAQLVQENNLPQKLLVLHQFDEIMIPNRDRIEARDGLATVFHVDGFGGRPAKLSKYDDLHAEKPFFTGFKLFYDEDINMFQPDEVLRLNPPPDFISYQ